MKILRYFLKFAFSFQIKKQITKFKFLFIVIFEMGHTKVVQVGSEKEIKLL